MEKTFQATRWFYIFLILHITAWTLAPTLIRHTLPMDAIEGATWGQQFAWGYDKNPFLNAWLTEWAIQIGGPSGWLVYLFSQLCIGACFYAIFQVGKKILNLEYALISVLFLEGIQFYNLHAIDFDDNTLEIGLWAVASFYFYLAVTRAFLRDWILTGILLGLGLMAKYYTLVLMACFFLFLLYSEQKIQFKKPGVYVALFSIILISLPHCVWLFSHDFITLRYMLSRSHGQYTLLNHVIYPIQFTGYLAEMLIIPLVITTILLMGQRSFLSPRLSLSTLNKQFLFFIGAGPALLTLCLTLLLGIELRTGWSAPLLSFSGLIYFAWLGPKLTPKYLYSYVIAIFILLGVAVGTYSFSLLHAGRTSSAHFPGKKIAFFLTDAWHAKYHSTFSYVAGPRFLAGNIALYSPDRPSVYMEWDPAASFWIDEKKLDQTGAIFVWEAKNQADAFPPLIQKRFPRLEKIQTHTFAWIGASPEDSVVIRYAFLPPNLDFKND